MRYRAIVGICFGSSAADLRQSVNVEFEFGGKTARGFKRAALQAARREYPEQARLFETSDTAIVELPFNVTYPILSVPRGVWCFTPRCGFVELQPNNYIV